MTTRPALAAATLLTCAAAAAADPHDVLCLTDARPAVVRLNFSVNGRPLTAAWGAFADALLAHLDANRSGTLDGPELVRLPQTLSLLAMRGGFSTPAAAPAMTRDALAEYLQAHDLGAFRVPPPAVLRMRGRRYVRADSTGLSESLDKALVTLLDADKDTRLSPAELAAAPAAFAKLDADENELISSDEVLGRPGVYGYVVVDESEQVPGRLDLLRLGRKADPLAARLLLDRYRPAGTDAAPRRLSRADLPLPEKTFAALDQDGDGELDAVELARFGRACPPDVELAFHIGSVPAGARPAAVLAGGGQPVRAAVTGSGAAVAVELPGMRFDLAPGGAAAPDLRGAYLNRFRQFDRDANGYLDEAETPNGSDFRTHFPLLDADGDGKVFEKELVAVVEALQPLAGTAAAGLVTSDVTEASRGLFGLFDANGDGQLSVRELRGLAKRAEPFVTAKDGGLRPADVPRRFLVTFAGSLAGPQLVRRGDDSLTANAPRAASGPTWFQRMDRNRDGDVSRREFLGSEAAFRRLDRDGDGLIDPREADPAR
ncbi:MAG TPA: EF-hand domain-containing protein [Urbifossiella sp.]|nr:EF-hand domain-containing protein [Urbifossiella sp.]